MRHLYLFSGMAGVQGPPLAALRALYARPENARYFTGAAEAVARVLDHVGADAYRRELPGGIPLTAWLRGDTPDAGAMEHSIVDGLFAHIYQLCLLQPAVGRAAGERPAPVAAIGHSLGLIGAMAAGLGMTSRREYTAFCHDLIAMTALTLIRCHQSAPPRTGAATPMAAVLGMPTERVRELVAGTPVHLALANSDRSHVLAGDPADLAELRTRHARRLAEPGVQWTYLRSTAPFHTPLLEPAVRAALEDRHFMTFPLTGDRLAIPVYVADSPVNLQHRGDLLPEVIAHGVCRPLDWPGTVRAAIDGCRPDQIVDFGPGPSARVFTRETLRGSHNGLRYRSIPAPTA
ncbi:ACP S-malonyltransferase [Allostreptomyces psammosilenae]|uniref:Malonyl CoA-acyl carrier protein transacylase n=1 Tax=Allostreptomyces psammosilenae TaxID=1892865 RepID=A0A853A1C3_9ACTN|nr:ACP S-malonyltransferase [Allostreptomyces psammosilenae]NYI04601.1 malonyl CoA-acyl carrier protein transacylase [Allostreptomyces psammosilenae]